MVVKPMLRISSLLLLLFAAHAAAEQATWELSPQDMPVQAASFLTELKARYNPYEIQDDPEIPDDCGSFYRPADSQVPYRGTVVFFHGFTACPQQFYELAGLLAQKGFATLVPLLPGQGRAPRPRGIADGFRMGGQLYKDYYSAFLPHGQDEDWRRYQSFVVDVNRFMASIPGEKVVGGLSVGGALATYAYTESPGLYRRALILAPYYGMPTLPLPEDPRRENLATWERSLSEGLYRFQEALVKLGTKAMESMAAMPASWGPDCYRQASGMGNQQGKSRAGICDFRIDAVSAINAFGQSVMEQVGRLYPATPPTQVQYVAVDWDMGSNTRLTRRALALQEQIWGPEAVDSCWYPSSVPHSFFSRADLSAANEASWLPSFLAQATEFVAEGQRFASDGASEERKFDLSDDRDADERLKRCAIF